MNASAKPPVGLIGLGIMGSAYAANLLKQGHDVLGFDPAIPARERLLAAGGRVAASAAEVADRSERILLALPTPAALDAVAREIGRHLRSGAVVCEMGTFALEDKEAARTWIEPRALLLDAPVSGTGAQAAVADLVIFASGDAGGCARMETIFLAIARKVVLAGAFGAGMKLKCVANLLVSVHNLATAEAMLLAQRSGLDLAMTFDAIREGAGNSRVWELRAPLMAEGRYEPATMKLEVHLKDLAVIKAFAASVGAPAPLLDAAAPFYRSAFEGGHGGEDTAVLFETLRGLPISGGKA